jgi:hypothetical protein
MEWWCELFSISSAAPSQPIWSSFSRQGRQPVPPRPRHSAGQGIRLAHDPGHHQEERQRGRDVRRRRCFVASEKGLGRLAAK